MKARKETQRLSQKQSAEQRQKLKPGDVVENQKLKQTGMLINSEIHDDYFKVISDGKITEWHISNIYLISDRIGE